MIISHNVKNVKNEKPFSFEIVILLHVLLFFYSSLKLKKKLL